MGLTPTGAAIGSALWELAEDSVKPKLASTLPADLLTTDSKANALCDVIAAIVGAGLGAKFAQSRGA
jgi:hypothetical protein